MTTFPSDELDILEREFSPLTTLTETRLTTNGKPYQVQTPIPLATDEAFDAWFVAHLREFLYRKGCKVEHLSDSELLFRTRNTFQTTTSRGGITTAKAVESVVSSQPLS